RHSRKAKLAIRVKFFTVKAVKQRSRCSSVKAAVVKAEPDSGHIRGKRAFPAVRSTPPPATKLLTMRCPSEKVKTQLGHRKSHFTRESGSAFPKFKCCYWLPASQAPTIFSTMSPMIGSLNFSC